MLILDAAAVTMLPCPAEHMNTLGLLNLKAGLAEHGARLIAPLLRMVDSLVANVLPKSPQESVDWCNGRARITQAVPVW